MYIYKMSLGMYHKDKKYRLSLDHLDQRDQFAGSRLRGSAELCDVSHIVGLICPLLRRNKSKIK